VIFPETCDDGPTSVIGCLSTCLGEDPRWTCLVGTPTSRSNCSPKCADGIKVGSETCDAGPNPGCLPTCLGPAVGYSCDGASPDICTPICGDGRVISFETCDDGPASHVSPFLVINCMPNCLSPVLGWDCPGGSLTT